MDFNHSDDRQMLADTLNRFVADRYDFETRKRIAASEQGYSPEIWRELSELGIAGALFGEEAGGFGGTGFDIMVVFEALGRGLVVEPFLGALMAGRALALAGNQDEAIAAIVSGSTIAAFAHQEPDGRYDLSHVATRAARDGEGWRLTGDKAVVAQAEAADHILISARTSADTTDRDGVSLFMVAKGAPGLSIRGYVNIDGGRAGEVRLADTPATLVGSEGQALPIVERVTGIGIVALAAEALGIMDVIKTMTLEYLRTRKQFGVEIGKFQALQHRMATVLLEIEQARSAVINAAAALDDDDAHQRDRMLAAAKFTTGRVGTLVAEEAIQMHGGIGMTWELPLSHYAKRLTMIDHQLGDEDHHLTRFIELGRVG